MNKKSYIATALLALAGVAGTSIYSPAVRAEGVPVKDLTLVQEEGKPETADPENADPDNAESEPEMHYYGGYHRHGHYHRPYHRGYYGGYYGGYRRYYGGYRSYYGGYRGYYGGYRYYRYEHDSKDGISTEGLETPEVEENK